MEAIQKYSANLVIFFFSHMSFLFFSFLFFSFLFFSFLFFSFLFFSFLFFSFFFIYFLNTFGPNVIKLFMSLIYAAHSAHWTMPVRPLHILSLPSYENSATKVAQSQQTQALFRSKQLLFL
jgi:hypothetical protein